MRASDIIAKKRDGNALTEHEIRFFIQNYTEGRIPDYQAAAWLMAVYLQGMDDSEARHLTLAMAESGDVLDLSDVAPFVCDKHSTGGVGDKVSLVVVPLAAACGLKVGKISGRGLGFTGGTLDKLESIPGYRTDLSEEEFKTQLAAIGMVLTGQTGSLAPADKKLYALRDVTATVSSIPLIVSSILSKKVASGADALVLDVKAGDGALMKSVAEAKTLAHQLVRLGNEVGMETVALVSDMNQPLGEAVGNALEVREAIATLHGGGPDDLRQHCLTVVAELLALAGSQQTLADGQRLAQERLDDGSGWEAFRTLVAAQSGDVSAIDDPDRLPSARLVETVETPTSGTLAAVDADEVGLTVMGLGGGREEKGDAIDHAVGVVSHVQIGDDLDAGVPLVTIHANDAQRLARARRRLLAAYTISQEPVEPRPLFHDRIRA